MATPMLAQLSAADAAPGTDAAAVTPADGSDLPISPARSLWVGTFGDVKIDTTNGNAVTFVGVQGLLPVRAKRVYSTGTTASNIVAIY